MQFKEHIACNKLKYKLKKKHMQSHYSGIKICIIISTVLKMY
jgi:hypothetical protein